MKSNAFLRNRRKGSLAYAGYSSTRKKSGREISSLVDLVQGSLSPEVSLATLDEVDANPDLSKDLEFIIAIDGFVREEGEEIFATRQTSLRTHVVGLERIWLSPRVRVRFWYTVVSTVLLTLVGITIMSRFESSRYFELACVQQPETDVNVRGPVTDDFESARRRFRSGDHDEAIRILERHIRAFPGKVSGEYARFLAGSFCLATARRDILGVYKTFDKQKVIRGMGYLSDVVRTSSNQRINGEAHILLGKGFLMLDDPDGALRELELLSARDGALSSDARELMSKIKAISK